MSVLRHLSDDVLVHTGDWIWIFKKPAQPIPPTFEVKFRNRHVDRDDNPQEPT